MNASDYRGDIDGLRAIAVLPIVLFHGGVSFLSGGFVGVDIFFVISGYLITGILAREMAEKRFSLLGFYHRRVVRIFPALFVMLAIVLAVGVLTLLPSGLRELGESAAATAGFVSNIYYWRTTDYFATVAELTPLLHTWSLGVEEQFYLFFPLLMLILVRLPRVVMLAAIWAAILVSFALGFWLAMVRPEAGFYLIVSRAWELGLGAVIALGAFPTVRSAAVRNALAILGLVTIAIGYVVIRADSAFPVPWALLPVAGTVLLIAYGKGAATATLLESGVMRWIGKISYSLYLWHWPVIAFWRIRTGISLDWTETVLLTAVSFGLAAASYYFVEQPISRRYRNRERARVLSVGGVVLVATVLASIAISSQAQRLRSYPPEVTRIASYVDYDKTDAFKQQFRPGPCYQGTVTVEPFDPKFCLPFSATKPNVIVVGDSHAAMLWRAFSERYPQWNVMQATASGCRPILGAGGSDYCREVFDYVLGPVVDSGRLDGLIIAGRWKPEEIGLLRPMLEKIKARGVKVWLVGPSVVYDGKFPDILANLVYRGRPVEEVRKFRNGEPEETSDELRRIAAETGVGYIDLVASICPDDECIVFVDKDVPMHWDYGHLTSEGAKVVVRNMPDLSQSLR